MSARNAEPETVALAVLDACERVARGCSLDYSNARNRDVAFMKEQRDRHLERSLVRCLARGLLQKTQTSKFPDPAAVARTPFWSFGAE